MTGAGGTRCQGCGKATGRRYAIFCDACRRRSRGAVGRYAWTEERDQVLRERYDPRVPGRGAEIAESLGLPVWAVKRRAALLGLTHPQAKRDWSPQDIGFLEEHAGARHVSWIARRLGRTEGSVAMKLRHLQISGRVRVGYNLRGLTLCFGVDHNIVLRWVREGKLQGRRIPGPGPSDQWKFKDTDILSFIREHPTTFRLDKVDQTWFLDFLFEQGVYARAVAGARKRDAGAEAPAPDQKISA